MGLQRRDGQVKKKSIVTNLYFVKMLLKLKTVYFVHCTC